MDGFYGGAGDFSYHGSATSNDAEPIVFVYGIGPHTDEDELWNMFSGFGNIVVCCQMHFVADMPYVEDLFLI